MVAAQERYAHRANRAPKLHKLDQFAKLQHNQPDIVLRYRRLQRKAVIEANAWNVNLTASTGLFNTDWLRTIGACGSEFKGKDCITEYENELRSSLMDISPSLSVYGEVGRITDLTIPLDSTLPIDLGPLLPPIPGLPAQELTIEGGKYWRYGGALGAMVEPVHESNGIVYSTRIDFAYDAWKLANNAERLDYDVLRLTVTRRIGAVSLVLNLMCRDRAKFRDANIAPNGVTAGLGYSIF
jgi:hypothetical protein